MKNCEHFQTLDSDCKHTGALVSLSISCYVGDYIMALGKLCPRGRTIVSDIRDDGTRVVDGCGWGP